MTKLKLCIWAYFHHIISIMWLSAQMERTEEQMIYFGVLILVFVLIVGFYCYVLLPFYEERDYIRREMDRAVEEEEYYYWKGELKRLYMRGLFGRF